MYVALVNVLNLNCPNSDATEETPNFNIVGKLLRNLLTKEDLFPMKKISYFPILTPHSLYMIKVACRHALRAWLHSKKLKSIMGNMISIGLMGSPRGVNSQLL